VLLPWSTWAMIEKLRILSCIIFTAQLSRMTGRTQPEKGQAGLLF